MQYFSNSTGDFALSAARKPCVTAIIASISFDDGDDKIGAEGRGGGDNHHIFLARLNNENMIRG
jgi:hypothetical protein